MDLPKIIVDVPAYRAEAIRLCQVLPGSYACHRAHVMSVAAESFASAIQAVLPSIIQIETVSVDPNTNEVDRRGIGSGIAFRDRYAITNAHVLADTTSIQVRYANGAAGPAKIVGYDEAADVGVIELATPAQAAAFGDSDAVQVGDVVLALGSPFGLENTVTSGIISAKGRRIGAQTFIQTDAAINPGSSGGALANLSGQVIGMNTMIIGRGQGIGFAIPSNAAVLRAQQIIANPPPIPQPALPSPIPTVPKKPDYTWVAVGAAGIVAFAGLMMLVRR